MIDPQASNIFTLPMYAFILQYGNTDAQLPGRIPPPLYLYSAPTNVTLCKETTSQWPVNEVENTEPSLRRQHRISPAAIVLYGLPPRVVQRDILPHYKPAGGSCASHDGLLPERGACIKCRPVKTRASGAADDPSLVLCMLNLQMMPFVSLFAFLHADLALFMPGRLSTTTTHRIGNIYDMVRNGGGMFLA